MSESSLTILVVEDELEIRAYLEVALKCLGYNVELAEDGVEAMEYLHAKSSEIAAVLLDFVPNRDGIDTLREIRQYYPDLPVIVVSGASSPLNIVTTMKNGATDFLSKPVTHEDLRTAITRALDVKTVECLRPVKSMVSAKRAFIGRSPRMEAIHAMIGQVGWSEAPVLIQGETGSGKEMIAQELHANSPRAKKAFFKLNCAALPSELVESELFGYERGAFTGAIQRKSGMFELASGGTILLDEIGDMDVRLQAKLLQVLQDQEFQRVGGKETIKVDVRVMAATHRDLEKAIEDGTFRQDLYYRLNVIDIVLPPLRDRVEDIVPLAEFLMKRHGVSGIPIPNISPELKQAMTTYTWPGNVRELENFMRKFLILGDIQKLIRELAGKTGPKITRIVSPATTAPATHESIGPAAVTDVGTILEQVAKAKQQAETDAILAALLSAHWNRKRAARMLNIDYKALLYKMKKLGIDDQVAPLPAASAKKERVMAASGY